MITVAYPDGSRYEGELSEGRKHGQGKFIWPDGSSYSGMWANDKPHGRGMKTLKVEGRRGELKEEEYDGEWLNGVKNGKGRQKYTNLAVYDGDWRDDRRHGLGELTTQDMRVLYGTWEADKFTGPALPEFADFRREHPSYDADAMVTLRMKEFGRLCKANSDVYLDYTGAGLYSERTQLLGFTGLLLGNVLGNTHSINSTSERTSYLVEKAREAVRSYFNAPKEEYEVVFTLNATNALKLVGESYPFHGGELVYLLDNHNSVGALREYATKASTPAKVTVVDVHPPELRARQDEVIGMLCTPPPPTGGRRLFAFPAQSNFTGVQHPLEWIAVAKSHGWDVLLDAAAFVPTNILDLALYKPDFVDLSFYKMFGFPTGVGALLVQKNALEHLIRPAFFGGTVEAVHATSPGFFLLRPGHAGFEDGTLNYLDIPAVELGLGYLQKIGMSSIHERVMALTEWMLTQLRGLRHTTGQRVVVLYGPDNVINRGGTLALNFRTPSGKFVDHTKIQQACDSHCHYSKGRKIPKKISLRYGCFCNPGALQAAMQATVSCGFSGHSDVATCMRATFGVAGAVRVSVGLASTFEDVHCFVTMVKENFVNQPEG